MKVKCNIQTSHLIMIILLILILCSIPYFSNTNQTPEDSMGDSIGGRKSIKRRNNLREGNNNIREKYYNNETCSNTGSNLRQSNFLDRIYNPTRYPYQSMPSFNSVEYNNYSLPDIVVGGGRRRIPTLGGRQRVINNEIPCQHITDDNIAPINIRTQGPEGQPQQVGTLYNTFSDKNEVLPLFGRKKFPNDSKWDYYAIAGQFGTKIPVIPLRNSEEIGTNDMVQLVNYPGNFRSTIYEHDSPQYIPYI
jgi:hypothetical protein